MDFKTIDQFEAGTRTLADSVRGLSRAELLARPVPGTWSIQQIVLHLLDSDLVIADRMKRIIAEENPALIGFDESKFAAALHYDDQEIADAVALFGLNRKMMARLLRRLPAEAFARSGTHSERGRETLAMYVEGACRHLAHHLKFLYDKRAKLGKPVAGA